MNIDNKLILKAVLLIKKRYLEISAIIATAIIVFLFAFVIFFRESVSSPAQDTYFHVANLQSQITKLNSDLWIYYANKTTKQKLEDQIEKTKASISIVSNESPYGSQYFHTKTYDSVFPRLNGIVESIGSFVNNQKPYAQPRLVDINRYSRFLESMYPNISFYSQEIRQKELEARIEGTNDLNKIMLLCATSIAFLLFFLLILTLNYLRGEKKEKEVIEKEAELAKLNAKTELEKTKFLAKLCHEIKSPVQAMQCSVEILQSKYKEGLVPWDLIDKLSWYTDQLVHITQDGLDLTGLKSGLLELNYSLFDITSVLKRVVEANKFILEEKGLSLKLDMQHVPLVITDEFRFRQIAWNLISNAIKYTNSGHVGIGFRLEKQEERCKVILIVEDSGIGIAQEYHENIFKPFYLLNKKGSHSSGLGLAIVSELVEHFGGSINIDSLEGAGTKFTVSIPVKLPKSSEDSERTKLLLVEDNDHIRADMAWLLSNLGYDVVQANSFDDAALEIKQNKFIIVFSDVELYDESGFDLAIMMRSSDKNEDTPFIAISANPGSLSDPRSQYVDDILIKPVSLEALDEMVKKHVHGYF